MTPFKYYLHDQTNSFEFREHLESQGVELTEEAWENVGRPFYEVTLDCEISDDGKVTLVQAVL